MAFVAATLWINYQVKVNVQGGGGHGTVYQMGNVKVGEAAPDFSTMDLSNRLVSLSSYRGQKVVLLDFWATWCMPCQMEMENLQTLQEKFKPADFEILSLNQQEEADVVRQFVARRQYGFHVLLDSGKVSARYGVRAIPDLVLVDRTGIIRQIQVGYSKDDSQLEREIKSLISK